MNLSTEEKAMLAGDYGKAARKAMEIITILGSIYGAKRLIPVSSVQVSGVSYDNLGEAGLEWLDEMAQGGGKARVLAALNPAGMDVDNWETLGISPEFYAAQMKVLDAYGKMGILTTCTCTPYLSGNLPHFGEHIAWAESSAVCYANSVIGARTNREGGPSALASALTGRTAEYGLHLARNRRPNLAFQVTAPIAGSADFGALGKAIGEKIAGTGKNVIPYITGIEEASLESLKSFCASIATYGGAALFHMQGVTPEAQSFKEPKESITITPEDIDQSRASLTSVDPVDVDFVSLGCPHLSILEIKRIAEIVEGRKVKKEFWITTSRPAKQAADRLGYSAVIEASGAKFAADTCCVVAPIKNRFRVMATDSAKACFYAGSKNGFKTVFKPFDEVVEEAFE